MHRTLTRYVDEQAFRFNERKTNDAGRFALVMPGVVGKRLTYAALIGATRPDNCKNDGAGRGGLANWEGFTSGFCRRPRCNSGGR
jgi:hypothetical protein